MTESALDRLREDVKSITVARLGALPAYGVLLPGREAWRNRIVTCLYARDRTPFAFSTVVPYTLALDGRVHSVFQLGLVVANGRSAQRTIGPLYSYPLAYILALRGFRQYWIAQASMIPNLIGFVTDTFVDVFPHYRHRRPPARTVRDIARLLVSEHRTGEPVQRRDIRGQPLLRRRGRTAAQVVGRRRETPGPALQRTLPPRPRLRPRRRLAADRPRQPRDAAAPNRRRNRQTTMSKDDAVVLRPWQPADNEALVNIARTMSLPARVRLGIDRAPDFAAFCRNAGDDFDIVVAEVKGRVAGFMETRRFKFRLRGSPVRVAYLALVGVEPGSRGRAAH